MSVMFVSLRLYVFACWCTDHVKIKTLHRSSDNRENDSQRLRALAHFFADQGTVKESRLKEKISSENLY